MTTASELAGRPPLDVAEHLSERLEARGRSQTRVRWELLQLLVRKDLKVKYQSSVLGFAWSLANPLLLLAIYGFVFQLVLKTGVPDFPVYLMSGLLVWNLFSSAVLGGAGSVVGNAGLVKKVRFPLPVLPLSAVGFALVHFVLQLGVLVAVLGVIRYNFFHVQLLLVVPAVAVALLFTVAFSTLVSALNVRYRDTQHLLELLLLAWFWANPIVYAGGLLTKRLGPHHLLRVFFADPMAIAVASMQRAFYRSPHALTSSGQGPRAGVAHGTPVLVSTGYSFYLEMLGVGAGVSLLLLLLARAVFRRMQADFAEEL